MTTQRHRPAAGLTAILVGLGCAAQKPERATGDSATDRPDPIVADGLALWFRCEDDLRGGAIDSASNHEAICSDPSHCPSSAPGHRGSACGFDGVEDHLRILAGESFRYPEGFSIALWLAPRRATSAVVFSKSAGATRSWAVELADDGALVLQMGAASIARDVGGTGANWFHVAGTWDGATMRLFVDGVVVDAQPNIDVDFDDLDILIGAEDLAGSIASYYFGDIDELRLYERPLTATEVRLLASD